MDKLKAAIRKLAQFGIRYARFGDDWYEIGYSYHFATNPREIINRAKAHKSTKWGKAISAKTSGGYYLRADGAPVSKKLKRTENRARRKQAKSVIAQQLEEMRISALQDEQDAFDYEQDEIYFDQQYMLSYQRMLEKQAMQFNVQLD